MNANRRLRLGHRPLGSNGRRKQDILLPAIRLLRGNDRHRKHASINPRGTGRASPDSSACFFATRSSFPWLEFLDGPA